MTRLNPKVDLAFKKIFGVEENKDLLISLINSIVSQYDQVSEIDILNPYNPQNFRNDKLSILDIKAKSITGKLYNIEIQITDEGDYEKRALYYWGRLYTQQLKTSDQYSKLNKAIGIHILNFSSIANNDDYHNVFHIIDKKHGQHYFKDLELHTIELRKFAGYDSEELNELVSKIHTALDVWVAFLTRNELLESQNLPKKIATPELNKALHVMDVMNLTEQELDEYEAHLKWLRAQTGAIETAEKKGLEKGREEGLEKGREEGLEKGREEGLEKGREEGLEKGREEGKIEGMLQLNANLNDIAKITGLSLDKVKNIADKLKK